MRGDIAGFHQCMEVFVTDILIRDVPTTLSTLLAQSRRVGLSDGAGMSGWLIDKPAYTRLTPSLEPSRMMIAPPGSAPAVQAVAEHLPVRSEAVDAALAVLTLHHWNELRPHAAVCATD